MNEPNADEIYKYIDEFNDIYDESGEEIKPIPNEGVVTIFCDNGGVDRGFMFNIDRSKNEGGLQLLIAKKWIEQEKLENLITQ